MSFKNVYEDSERAEAYAKLEFPAHIIWRTAICLRS